MEITISTREDYADFFKARGGEIIASGKEEVQASEAPHHLRDKMIAKFTNLEALKGMSILVRAFEVRGLKPFPLEETSDGETVEKRFLSEDRWGRPTCGIIFKRFPDGQLGASNYDGPFGGEERFLSAEKLREELLKPPLTRAEAAEAEAEARRKAEAEEAKRRAEEARRKAENMAEWKSSLQSYLKDLRAEARRVDHAIKGVDYEEVKRAYFDRTFDYSQEDDC